MHEIQQQNEVLPLKAVFTGRVYPERSFISIIIPGSKIIVLDKGSGVSGTLAVNIDHAQVTASYFNATLPNLFDLKNSVDAIARMHLDILGYTKGWSLDLEITQAYIVDTNKTVVFGINIPSLELRGNQSFENILPIFQDERSDYLRRCFADLRQAMKMPADTGELCFRAIETLRKFFIEKHNLDDTSKSDTKKSWELLRQELEVERQTIDSIMPFAVDVRHGGTRTISGVERDQIFASTWDIVDKYIAFAKNGYEPISKK